MADAADLKSVVRKDVRVRLPPSAPFLISLSHMIRLKREEGEWAKVNGFVAPKF